MEVVTKPGNELGWKIHVRQPDVARRRELRRGLGRQQRRTRGHGRTRGITASGVATFVRVEVADGRSELVLFATLVVSRAL